MIGTLNENSLHAELKQELALPGDELEYLVEGFHADIFRSGTIIEIQTGGFGSMKRKLKKLLPDYRIHLVYPLPEVSYIVKISPETGERLSRRKSPKRGLILHIFDELMHITPYVSHENFSFEVIFTEEENIRCADGTGSWRRKGERLVDRKLLACLRTMNFFKPADYRALLPEGLPQEFTNKNLAALWETSVYVARKASYCLRKIGVIHQSGKAGRELLFAISNKK